MKKLLVLMLLCGIARADVSKNPDRYTSIGLNYQESQDTAQLARQELFDPADQSLNWSTPQSSVNTKRVSIDLRVPVTNFVTVNVNGGPSQLTAFGATNSGYTIGAGIRLYLPGLTN